MERMKANQNNIDAATIETSNISINPDSGMFQNVEVNLHVSHTKLFQLVHFQELDLVIDKVGNEVESVTCAFDLISWDELNVAQNTVQKAVVRAALFSREEIRAQLSLVCQRNKKWNLIYTLWLDSPEINLEKVQRAQLVGTEVLRALGNNLNNPTGSLCFEQLLVSDQDAVRAVAHETLCEAGGRSFKKPMAILVDDKIQLTLSGKLGAKPSRSNFSSTAAELRGKCRGFVNDHRQHTLLFSQNGRGDVEIGFMAWQLEKAVISLADIEVWNRQQVECKVQTKQTTDARGKMVYEFVSMEPSDDLVFVPDLFTPAMEDKTLIATGTGITNSNESGGN